MLTGRDFRQDRLQSEAEAYRRQVEELTAAKEDALSLVLQFSVPRALSGAEACIMVK